MLAFDDELLAHRYLESSSASAQLQRMHWWGHESATSGVRLWQLAFVITFASGLRQADRDKQMTISRFQIIFIWRWLQQDKTRENT